MDVKKVLALGVAGLLSLSVVGCSNSTNGSKPEDQVSSSVVADSKTEKQSSDKASSVASQKSYNIGEAFENDDVKITYDSCEKDWTGYTEGKPKEGNKIVRAHFTIENKTSEDIYVGGSNFYCYADGSLCEDYYATVDDMISDELSAGRKVSGYVYFEVPANASKIELEYDDNFQNIENGEIIFNVA